MKQEPVNMRVELPELGAYCYRENKRIKPGALRSPRKMCVKGVASFYSLPKDELSE